MSTSVERTARLEAPPAREPSPSGVSRHQALLYARDVARLLDQLRRDARRLESLDGRIQGLARTTLALVEAASAEAAGAWLADDLASILGVSRVVVYAGRGPRLRLLAARDDAQHPPSITREALAGLPSGPGPAGPGVADALRGLPAPSVIPFPGRGGRPVGFAAVPGPVTDDRRSGLELIARFVGVLLESHLLDEARLEARRPGSRPISIERVPWLGESEPMRRIAQVVQRVAGTSAPVLLLGETGTGKEVVARGLHDRSGRKGAFVAVNCGALPENLVESEIFGHEAGAFTGAQRRQRGKVEQAAGGTLFLDEVGEMPRPAQVKLLRFLQDSRYTPIGGEGERAADVRIIAATNRDLPAAVRAGEFREDLLFRLNVLTIDLPPLRARGDDVVLLARDFVRDAATRLGRPLPALGAEHEACLRAYSWPGNVRELRNVIERAVILSADGELAVSHLPTASRPALPDLELEQGAPPEGGLFVGIDLDRSFADCKAQVLERFEEAYCRALLERHHGNLARAARAAGMDRKNLARKVSAHGLRLVGRSALGPPRGGDDDLDDEAEDGV